MSGVCKAIMNVALTILFRLTGFEAEQFMRDDPATAARKRREQLNQTFTVMSGYLSDPEARPPTLHGYPSLASFIASDRDRTTLIFKRFDVLAARNLLYLQSELASLHHKQQTLDEEDKRGDMGIKQCARNWEEFVRVSMKDDDSRQKERWELMLRIRHTMKEYREALMAESTLASIPPPPKRVLRAFRNEFFNGPPDDAKRVPTLGGHSRGIYDDIDDLVALSVQEHHDRLTSFAQDHLGFFFPVSCH